jgi:OFA family oxalate/formate antiporter-like MFS transporter
MKTNRWIIAFAGVLLQFAFGAVYAWSVFCTPLMEKSGWSISQVTLTFAISISALGFSAIFGGLWLNRRGPRVVTLMGGLLYGLESSWRASRITDSGGCISVTA